MSLTLQGEQREGRNKGRHEMKKKKKEERSDLRNQCEAAVSTRRRTAR
jgi:hypothetical protein